MTPSRYKSKLRFLFLAGVSFFALWAAPQVFAQKLVSIPSFNLQVGRSTSPDQVASTLQVIALLTVLTLAPAVLIMTTSFTRIIIVLGFLRNALGTQQSPPNQVLLGFAMFLTFFIMAPTWGMVYDEALQPYFDKKIGQDVAMNRAMRPIKKFMVNYTREKDLALFVRIAKIKRPKNISEVPVWVVIPAFVISELKTAFQMGFIIYIPFLVIDMVVASVLMAMGMMMLPPIMISLPFKLMLFVLVDGWFLLTNSLVKSFTG
ncbi:MAG: flagellar type III secretion system pore protein FliP [SAR324 cluster bacterium]|nr:flagellar type III secretion system pore protein FliP [SAR324 cluster bacterium]